MNAVIVLALGLVVVMTVRVVRDSGASAASERQTVTVDTGTVSATVSASGNTAAATTVGVSFEGTGGIVRRLYVEEGDKVRKDQVLAVVDQTSARQGLASARAQLVSAQAGYRTTTQGLSPAERAQNAASVASAETSVHSAEVSLRSARATYALDRRQQNSAVERAEHALAAASPDQKGAARTELIQARNTRASKLLQDRQQISTQEVGLASARDQLATARASAAVAAQAPRSGELQSAQAQVDSAQVAVDQARTALDQTVLRAPVGGTVASVNGAAGQSSSASSSSSSSDSTSSTSGFIELTSKNQLEVTAYVAEADIADVEVGQSATVTLSATGAEVAGEVSSVDTVATVTNNVVEYGVTVRLDKTKGVRLGQTTQLVISTGEKNDVTRVSSSALTTIGDRTTATVQHHDGSTDTVVVTTGLKGDSQTEVLSGLEPGDVVVLPQQEGSDSGFTFPAGGPGGGPVGGLGGGP